MNRFFMILSIIVFVTPNIAFSECKAGLPTSPSGDSDPFIYPYIKYMFSIDDCSINDQLKFKMKTTDDPKTWEEVTISLGDKKYVNLFMDKNNSNQYLFDSDGADKAKNYLFKNIILFPETYENLLCLSYPTVNGSIPLICKNYTGPSRHYDPDNNDPTQSTNPCYNDTKHSKTYFNFSGRVIDCMTETLDKVFFRKSLSSRSVIANFVDFQHSLQKTIFAALLLYVIFFGIKIILEPNKFDLPSTSKFVLTFVSVLYFSVGLNVFSWDGSKMLENGFISQAFPFFKSMSSSLANLVLNSSTNSGLCDFSSVQYETGKEFYQLWDSIDCRIFNYLGVSAYEIVVPGLTLINPTPNFHLNYVMLVFAFIISGNILLFIFGILFFIYFISLILFFISTFCVYLITLYVMAYISPIFIPMALFEKTKGYFDAWLRICISCSLQPAILAGFIVLILSFYDQILYTGCSFKTITDNSGIISFAYADNITEECKNSLGTKLIRYYTGEGFDTINLILFKVSYVKDILNINAQMALMMFFCILGHFFSKYLTKFSANITGGPNVGSLSFSPSGLLGSLGGMFKGGNDKSGDSNSQNNNQSKDQISGGNTASRDQISGITNSTDKIAN